MNATKKRTASRLAPFEVTTQIRHHEEAREIYRGNWDGDGVVSVAIPAPLVDQLLAEAGWGHTRDGAYYAPDGVLFWGREEALRYQLAAMTLAATEGARS